MKKKILILVLLIACSFGLLLVPSTKKASASELDCIEVKEHHFGYSLSVFDELQDEYGLPVLFRKDDRVRINREVLESLSYFVVFGFYDTMDCVIEFDYSNCRIFTEYCSCELAITHSEHCDIYDEEDGYVYIAFNFDSLVWVGDGSNNIQYFTIIPHETHLSDYEKGYQDGFNVGKDSVDITIDNQEQYDKGYEDGYTEGYDMGYFEGVQVGDDVVVVPPTEDSNDNLSDVSDDEADVLDEIVDFLKNITDKIFTENGLIAFIILVSLGCFVASLFRRR